MATSVASSDPVDLAPDDRSSAVLTALPDEVVNSYRRNGFVQLRRVLSAAEVQRYARAATEVYMHGQALNATDPTFKQVVDVWRDDPILRELTLHRGLAEAATQLAGLPLRLWHDQLLMKAPHNVATSGRWT